MESNNIDHKKEPTFVKIHSKDSLTHISYAFHILKAEISDHSKRINYYVPAFDMYYFAENDEEGDMIGDVMMKSFFDFWFKSKGIDKLALELNRLGFTAKQHKTVMANLIKKRTKKADFTSIRNSVPHGFESASVLLKTGQLESA